MSYFVKTNVTPLAFVGQIVAYVGTSDPDGWLICDGRLFTDSTIISSSNYNESNLTTLISMLANSLRLPDLRNRTLVGGWLANETRSFSANANTTYTLKENDLPRHWHNLSINNDVHTNVKHIHNYTDYLHIDSNYYNNESPDTGDQSTYGDRGIASTSTSHNHNANAFSSTGSGTEINFLNKCYTVNWIIKY